MRAWRRTAFVGVAVSGAVLVTAAISPGAGAAPGAPTQSTASFNNGIGSAIASSLRVNPVSGGLSFGIGVGEALAGHQNTVGTAESRSANLGVIGVTLAAEGCSGGDPTLPASQQPIALRVDSTQPGSDAGITNTDHLIPAIERTVRATQAPFAEAETTFPGIDIPGIVSIGPVTTRTTSGVFDDYREAIATVEVGKITLLGGMIELDALKWESIHRSGSIEEQSGTFTIGAAKGPLQLPLPTDSVLDLLDTLNTILRPLGLEIRVPRFHIDTTANSTLSTVDPLAIAIIPAPLRDNLVSSLLNGLKLSEAKQNLTNALIAADCDNATYVTILDVVLAAISPAGYFALEVGGTQASTSAINAFQSGGPTTPTTRQSTTATTANRTTATTARSTTATTRSTATTAAPATTATTATDNLDDAVETADVSGERGGPLLAVGAGGLLLLLATAEGDRRKMRRAQRAIPLEG